MPKPAPGGGGKGAVLGPPPALPGASLASVRHSAAGTVAQWSRIQPVASARPPGPGGPPGKAPGPGGPPGKPPVVGSRKKRTAPRATRLARPSAVKMGSPPVKPPSAITGSPVAMIAGAVSSAPGAANRKRASPRLASRKSSRRGSIVAPGGPGGRPPPGGGAPARPSGPGGGAPNGGTPDGGSLPSSGPAKGSTLRMPPGSATG